MVRSWSRAGCFGLGEMRSITGTFSDVHRAHLYACLLQVLMGITSVDGTIAELRSV